MTTTPHAQELTQLLRRLIQVAQAALSASERGAPSDEQLERVRRTGIEIGELARKINLSDLPSGAGLEAVVRRAILDQLPDADTGLDGVARRLNLSARVLQSRLQRAGTSYNALLDQVRREVAEYHLRQPELSLLDVAVLVGYSDASAFHRAFKRWTQKTPGEFRRAVRRRR